MQIRMVHKLLYIKSCTVHKLFKNSVEDMVYNANDIKKMVYCHETNTTSIHIKDEYGHRIRIEGDCIQSIIEGLHKDYTKGIIIDKRCKVKEIL
jgi:hypothetical protein